jgi:uncharacterized protein
MPPTIANGKICYIEIPATDIARSAEFYRGVFGWHIRRRGDGSTAFDDTTGQVSGARVLRRPAAAAPGLLVYVMVGSVAARFRDPAGNAIGLYRQTAGLICAVAKKSAGDVDFDCAGTSFR